MRYETESGLRRHRRGEEPEKKYQTLRQWLNILFMIGAVVGIVVFYQKNTEYGTIIIIAAMALKAIECVLRMI